MLEEMEENFEEIIENFETILQSFLNKEGKTR